MKHYNKKTIKSSEIFQILILHSLYSLKESKDVYFQGGTAIRWCYNGSRFSEDLDFVSHLGKQDLDSLIHKISENIRRGIVAHIGPGEFEVKQKKTRDSSHVSLLQFRPLKERKKISVKMEFEQLKEGSSPETEKIILAMLPFVRHFISVGEFRIPNSSSIIVVETREEILSDKVRALLEREYLKGRDFYDLWFLRSLGVKCKPYLVKNKLGMYKAHFKARRDAHFFSDPNNWEREKIIESIQRDLSRFLPPEEMSLFKNNDFKDIFDSLKVVFAPLGESEQFLPENKGLKGNAE